MTYLQQQKELFEKVIRPIIEFPLFESNGFGNIKRRPDIDNEAIKDAWESSLLEYVKLVDEKVEHHNAVLRGYLIYCQEQNGRNDCKNCGLSEEDLLDLSELQVREKKIKI